MSMLVFVTVRASVHTLYMTSLYAGKDLFGVVSSGIVNHSNLKQTRIFRHYFDNTSTLVV